jgi:ribosomal protein S18 acetylase RimI-like enzyme
MKNDKAITEVKVQKAGTSDIDELYSIAKKDLGKYSWFKKASLIKNMKEEPGLCFVMKHKNNVEGAIFFRQEWNEVVWCWLIFVNRRARRKGLARAFESKVLKQLKKKKYRIVYLEVDESNNNMIRWCRKNKYRHVCRFPDWFGKGKHAIIFRKNIS